MATGDAGNGPLAQDPQSLNGKFLRLAPAQYRGGPSRPEIVSLGHRNPQGFDWEPRTGRLIRPSTDRAERRPAGLRRGQRDPRGRNYGWPEVYGEDHGDFAAPLRVYEEAIAPRARRSPRTATYVFATLLGEALRRLRIDGDEVTADDVLLDGEYGRLRTVVTGPTARSTCSRAIGRARRPGRSRRPYPAGDPVSVTASALRGRG